MPTKKKMFTPWSSLDTMLGKLPYWWPEEEQARIASYDKYDQMYWNDPTQYAIRVLENEQPIYVPNARTIVDTTAQYLLKGMRVVAADGDAEAAQPGTEASKNKSASQKIVDDYLQKIQFYSKFHINKQAGIARGDWLFHVRADPDAPEGERVSIDTLHPGSVYKVWDEDDPDKVLRMHVVDIWKDPKDENATEKIRKLTYEKQLVGGQYKIWREEAIYEIEPKWYGPEPKKVKQTIQPGHLPDTITDYPIYWFKNIDWESQDYGSSDLRGLEFLEWAVSQGATDTSMALGLEGLGVYATDGGRPVDDAGNEGEWEVSPGKVMEVPAGSYFRRVEGVGSITPAMENIGYLEKKMFMAAGMTDVALGQVDVAVAQSGVALAIKFMPTLARIEHRDTAGMELLGKMFKDLIGWFEAYDPSVKFPEVKIFISESKLPTNRTEKVNELNNMLDRKIISRKFYRREMNNLGYTIPDDIDKEIQEEAEADAKLAALNAPPGLQGNAEEAAAGRRPFPPESDPDNGKVDRTPNRSNNRSRPNESSGTESGQTLRRQARPPK